jgi:magnesium-transporting ATPase (P-type)
VPVRKVPYSPAAEGVSYDPDKHAGCTLYGGTCVAQARGGPGQAALAMVVRTRFYSAKGQLLRSILFPREHSESFISDSLKFIGVMLLACIGLFIWAAVVLASVGAHKWRIVVRFFDMVTIAVPPALPACLTIATVFSIGRLRKRSIYVTGPHTITTAGQLDVVCFDKTGTLTEQGLELQAIVPVTSGTFGAATKQMEQLPALLPQLLASCHGLARMGEVLVGDPLDQKLFAATGWSLVDGHSQQQGSGEVRGRGGVVWCGVVWWVTAGHTFTPCRQHIATPWPQSITTAWQ